jgi:glycosyltransferase involved in cell wall biosynthesis
VTARRIRVLIGTEYLNEGGVGRQIDYLVRELDTDRFEVHLAVFRKKDLFFTDLLEIDRVRTFLVAGGRGVGPRSWLALARAFREIRPDIVHLFGGKANHMTRRELVERSKYPAANVVLQHNFLDTERFRPLTAALRDGERRRLAIESGTVCLATVGRLAPQKNQLAVVDALAALKSRGRLPGDLLYLMVGRDYDARYAERLKRRIEELDLGDACRFAGPTKRIVELYNAIDGLIMPSTYEGLCNTVLEAQACGTPVALSREGDNDGLMDGGRAGISFAASDRKEVEEALLGLYDAAKGGGRRENMTGHARDEAVRRFSLRTEVRRLEGKYTELAERGGKV